MDDPVATLDGVVDRVVEVGERGLERHQALLLEAFARRGDARLRRMVDEVRCEELVEEPELAAVDHLERDALDNASCCLWSW